MAVSARWRTVALGCAICALFLAGYLALVRPARVLWAQHVALPAVTSVADGTRPVAQPPGQPVVEVSGREHVERYTAPGGITFLIAGALLAATRPRKPWWLYLLGYHVLGGALALGFFVLGASGVGLGFEAERFVATFLIDVVTLVVPVWLVFRPPPPMAASAAGAPPATP